MMTWRVANLLLMVLWAMHAAAQNLSHSAAETIQTLHRAELLITKHGALPPTNSIDRPWQTVVLPDAWPLARYQHGDNGWYRFEINRSSPPTTQWGIYLPRLNMNAAVYFNGELLGDGGSFEQPIARNWTRPLYFRIPSNLWRAGQNEILVRLRSDAGVGMLAPVQVGPGAALLPRYQRAYFFQISLNEGFFLVTLVTSLFFFSLWLKRRNDSQYGWFALTAFAWSIFSLNHFIPTLPMPVLAWDWLIFSSIAWWTSGLAMFIHRHIGYHHALIERALIAYALLAMVLYASVGRYLWVVAAIWMAGSIVIGFCGVARLLWYRRHLLAARALDDARQLSGMTVSVKEASLLALGITIVVLFGITDWLVQNNIIHGIDDAYAHHHLLPYSAPPLFLFIAWHLVRRFVTALDAAEELNAQLETRVAANREELEKTHVKLRELERNRVLIDERNRIFRDLHDGLGGIITNISLLSNLAQQETARELINEKLKTISALSEEGMNEIRTHMRELDNTDTDWHSLVADLRIAGSNLLEPYDIESRFFARLENPEATVDSMLQINLIRFHKEVLMNVIKHAKAKHVTLNIEVTSRKLHLSIEDDGVGLNGAENSTKATTLDTFHNNGHGLKNLAMRANKMGGLMTLHSERGTRVALEVPLP